MSRGSSGSLHLRYTQLFQLSVPFIFAAIALEVMGAAGHEDETQGVGISGGGGGGSGAQPNGSLLLSIPACELHQA